MKYRIVAEVFAGDGNQLGRYILRPPGFRLLAWVSYLGICRLLTVNKQVEVLGNNNAKVIYTKEDI